MQEYEIAYQKKYAPLWGAMKPISPKLTEELTTLSLTNTFLRKAYRQDSFNFVEIEDIQILKLYFEHGNWGCGCGVIHKNLFFCNQVAGGDEWWTCRYDEESGTWRPFESISFRSIIRRNSEEGSFESLIGRMLSASAEQCVQCTY